MGVSHGEPHALRITGTAGYLAQRQIVDDQTQSRLLSDKPDAITRPQDQEILDKSGAGRIT